MIELKCNEGRCKTSMNGTGSMLTAETGTIIKAIYHALMQAAPGGLQDMYANLYRLSVLRALSECTPITDFNSSYPDDIKP